MNSLLKKIVGIVMVVCMISQFAVFASAENSIIDEVGYVYDFVDLKDTTISGAYLNSKILAADDVSDSILSSLITDAVKDVYSGDEASAKAGIVDLIAGTLMAHFAQTKEEFSKTLVESKEKTTPVISLLFGADYVDSWYEVVLKARKNAQSGARWTDKKIWATGSKGDPTDDLTELFESLDSLQISEMNQLLNNEYKELGNKITELGWSASEIVKATRFVASIVDDVEGKKNSAEFALIKAACRSTARLNFDGTDYSAKLDPDTIVYSVDKLPQEIPMSLYILDGYNVTNLVGYSITSDNVNISRDEVNEKIVLDFEEGKNGITDILLKRDPYRNNSSKDADWLVKLRVVAAYEIKTPDIKDIDWNGNNLSWEDVEHASKYVVEIYKDGEYCETVETTSAKFDATNYIHGDGSYTLKVKAIGSLEEYEESDFSVFSKPLVIESRPGKVSKPEWKSQDSLIITWVPLDDESIKGYNVYLYKDGVLMSGAPYKASATANEFDLATAIGNNRGSFTVSIQAYNNNGNGEMSDKSDAMKLIYNNITGKILLQGINRITLSDGTTKNVRKNNAGITVSVGAFSAETLEDGSFVLKNIPDGSYELKVSKPGYLTLKKQIVVTGGSVEINKPDPIVLLYGDFDGFNGIGAPDIASIIAKIGKVDLYDENFDIDEDGTLFTREISGAISNAGKVSSDYDY